MDNGPLNNTQDQTEQQPSNQRGTGFTNLQQYLQANQNNNLDPYIGGQLQNESSGLQNQINQNQNTFQSDLGQAKQSLQNNQSEANSVLSDPTSANSQQVADFANFRTPQAYSGPNGLSDYNDLYNQSQNLQGLGNQLQNGNVQNLLGRYFSGNQYTTGDQNFDSMLLGAAPNIRQGINSLNQVSPDQVNYLNRGDVGQAQGLQGQQNLFTQGVQQKLGLTPQGTYDPSSTTGLLQQVQNPIAQQLQKYQALQAQDMPAIQNALQNGGNLANIDPAAYNALGLNNLAGNNGLGIPGTTSNANQFYTYGVNPLDSQFYTPSALNANTVATPQQAAQYAALVNLSGIQPNLLSLSGSAPTIDATGKPEGGYSVDPNTQYGTTNANNLFGQFNNQAYQNAVASAKNSLNPILQQYNTDYGNQQAAQNAYNNLLTTNPFGGSSNAGVVSDQNAINSANQQLQSDMNNLNAANPNWNSYFTLPQQARDVSSIPGSGPGNVTLTPTPQGSGIPMLQRYYSGITEPTPVNQGTLGMPIGS